MFIFFNSRHHGWFLNYSVRIFKDAKEIKTILKNEGMKVTCKMRKILNNQLKQALAVAGNS
jgi:hypothetical protein